MVKTKASRAITARNTPGRPSAACTASEDTAKAASDTAVFFRRPDSTLSKSTKPPAITPSTNGIVTDSRRKR